MSFSTVKHISECFIKPKYNVEESKHPYCLSPWGLTFLRVQYIQSGLLFHKPQLDSSLGLENLLERLKDSLSRTLVHFYPLAGQLATRVDEDRHECLVFVDCTKGFGAKFIHATLDMTMFDVLSPTYVPRVVHSFFDLNEIANHDGHAQPLLSVQVTELVDGIFIGVSMNHAVADGTAFWHFWNTWSDIHEAIDENQVSILRPPVHDFLFPNDRGPEIWFPFTNPDEFVNKHKTPQLLRVRIFHFSSKSIRMLKEKANKESNTCKISSLQALTALVWRSITRANLLSHHDQVTKCGLSINNRPRLHPPLPPNYFRSSMDVVRASTTVGELLEHSLGWAALLVHQAVVNQTDKVVHESMKTWLQSPCLYERGLISLMMTMSPRFEIYRNGFGRLGKPLAARNGCNNTFRGNVVVYPGYEGGGSMDLEVHLPSELIEALESDKEFMDVASEVYHVW